MIVGHGLLARAFEPRYGDDPRVTIFASGVSNSRESVPAAFERERAMLVPLLHGRGLLRHLLTRQGTFQKAPAGIAGKRQDRLEAHARPAANSRSSRGRRLRSALSAW